MALLVASWTHARSVEPPQIGGFQTVIIPMWLAQKRGQLNSAVAYEKSVWCRVRQTNSTNTKGGHHYGHDEGQQRRIVQVHPQGRCQAYSPNAPAYTGDILIDGIRYRLAGWVRESTRGKFLSLSVKPDDDAVATKPKASNGGKGFDKAVVNEIPF